MKLAIMTTGKKKKAQLSTRAVRQNTAHAKHTVYARASTDGVGVLEASASVDPHEEDIFVVGNLSTLLENVVLGVAGTVGIVYVTNGDRVQNDDNVDANLLGPGGGVQYVVSGSESSGSNDGVSG